MNPRNMAGMEGKSAREMKGKVTRRERPPNGFRCRIKRGVYINVTVIFTDRKPRPFISPPPHPYLIWSCYGILTSLLLIYGKLLEIYGMMTI